MPRAGCSKRQRLRCDLISGGYQTISLGSFWSVRSGKAKVEALVRRCKV